MRQCFHAVGKGSGKLQILLMASAPFSLRLKADLPQTEIKLNNFFVPLRMNLNTEKIKPAGKTGADIQNLESYSATYKYL